MKWIGLVLALAACGARDVVAPAPTFSESTAHVGVATNGKDYVVPFTTNAIGDLTVTADWTPKSAAAYYVLRVFYGDALVCSVSKGSPQVAGHYVCAIAGAPAGDYSAVFIPGVGAGQTPVAITVDGETD